MTRAWVAEDRHLVARLLRRVASGDDLAFARIYDDYSPTVYGLALRITGDRDAAEEVTQDVFVRLWEQPDAYDPARGELRPWLATIARRRSVDWLRRTTTRRRQAQILARERHENVNSTEDAVVRDSISVAVRHAVDRLPEPNRSAIRLAYYGGLTYRDVADTLGIPEGTAKSRLRAGLQRLTAHLTAAGILDS